MSKPQAHSETHRSVGSSEEQRIVTACLALIQEHVLDPLKYPELRKSCLATLLPLFAAIDGLGRLTHDDDDAGVGERFCFFLRRLGSDYIGKESRVYKLRNSLAHSALNEAAFMSHSWLGDDEHLNYSTPPSKHIFVSTNQLHADFSRAFHTLKTDFSRDENLLQRAARRLRWVDYDPASHWPQFSTPPGPVDFVILSEGKRSRK